MSYITSIGIANPKHQLNQASIANFMVKVMQLGSEDERKLRAVFRMSGIETRHSVLSDYGREQDFEFYPNQMANAFPSTSERLEVYEKYAVHLSADAASRCLQPLSIDRQEITNAVRHL